MKYFIFLFLLPALFLSSCGTQDFSYFSARQHYEKGNFNEALTILEELSKHDQWKRQSLYNAGIVARTIGNVDAALAYWGEASLTGDVELLWMIEMNKGILMFESGKYEQAVDFFRRALDLFPSRHEGKIALELAISRIQYGIAPIPEPKTLADDPAVGETGPQMRIFSDNPSILPPWVPGDS